MQIFGVAFGLGVVSSIVMVFPPGDSNAGVDTAGYREP